MPNHYPEHYPTKKKMLRIVIWNIFGDLTNISYFLKKATFNKLIIVPARKHLQKKFHPTCMPYRFAFDTCNLGDYLNG
jgi:hypothetical protein